MDHRKRPHQSNPPEMCSLPDPRHDLSLPWECSHHSQDLALKTCGVLAWVVDWDPLQKIAIVSLRPPPGTAPLVFHVISSHYSHVLSTRKSNDRKRQKRDDLGDESTTSSSSSRSGSSGPDEVSSPRPSESSAKPPSLPDKTRDIFECSRYCSVSVVQAWWPYACWSSTVLMPRNDRSPKDMTEVCKKHMNEHLSSSHPYPLLRIHCCPETDSLGAFLTKFPWAVGDPLIEFELALLGTHTSPNPNEQLPSTPIPKLPTFLVSNHNVDRGSVSEKKKIEIHGQWANYHTYKASIVKNLFLLKNNSSVVLQDFLRISSCPLIAPAHQITSDTWHRIWDLVQTKAPSRWYAKQIEGLTLETPNLFNLLMEIAVSHINDPTQLQLFDGTRYFNRQTRRHEFKVSLLFFVKNSHVFHELSLVFLFLFRTSFVYSVRSMPSVLTLKSCWESYYARFRRNHLNMFPERVKSIVEMIETVSQSTS